jgi:hypothetical protein
MSPPIADTDLFTAMSCSVGPSMATVALGTLALHFHAGILCLALLPFALAACVVQHEGSTLNGWGRGVH